MRTTSRTPIDPARAGALVLSLGELDASALQLGGGKAKNLGDLLRAGLPVPGGFCVTTTAFRATLAGGPLGPILDAIEATEPGDLARLAQLAGEARAAVLATELVDELRARIAAAYGALAPAAGGDAPVAVRSSATAEDLPDHSFAGQQDTFLNVVGAEAVLDAVRRCFASLYTDRAVAYRRQRGLDGRGVALAVVVQRLIDAAVAGVLFTADPISGRRGVAVIDASPGLGEAVVSGAVNPDHFEVEERTGRVLARRLGDKRVAIRSLPGGGTRHEARAAETGQACLSDAELLELSRLGRRVQEHFGSPQDLEWALDAERRLYLLQARPITTLYPLPADAPASAPVGNGAHDIEPELHVYFNFNVAQGVLGPLTPIGQDAWRRLGAGMLRFLGLPQYVAAESPSFIKASAGRLLLDVTGLVRSDLGRRLVAAVMPRMEARSGPIFRALFEDPRLSPRRTARRPLLLKVLGVATKLGALPSIARALRDPPRGREQLAQARAELHRLAAVPAHATPAERLAAVEKLLGSLMGVVMPRLMPLFLGGYLSLQLARRLLGGLATATEIDEVLRSLPHNPTTEMDLELWGLVVRLRKDAASAAALHERTQAELAAAYRAGTLPKELQEGLGAFLDRYGYRGVAEIDLGQPRWRDAPEHILGSLRNYLDLGDAGQAPDAQFKRGEAAAAAAVDDLTARAAAKGRLRGRAVRFFLDRTRALAGLREAPKALLVEALAAARAQLLRVGGELVARGRLAAADDILFLSLAEAGRALDGADLGALAEARRQEHGRERLRRRVPRVLLSDGTAPEGAPSAAPGRGGLSGTPASAGTVTGIARVVMDPIGARVVPGEILVAPSTDPGWTPLFLTAAGLVMEMGGAMSHGAVVAREYGIPAVVGVADATLRIRPGQRLTLDGAAGTITIHPDKDDPPEADAQAVQT